MRQSDIFAQKVLKTLGMSIIPMLQARQPSGVIFYEHLVLKFCRLTKPRDEGCIPSGKSWRVVHKANEKKQGKVND